MGIGQNLRIERIALAVFFDADCEFAFGRLVDGPLLEAHMPKASLVSIVEDDRFFRESMRRLMRSLGYAVETFPAAADFLASRRLAETGCLIADVHMPVMSGLELHSRLAETGRAIPTILVTAYPDEAVKARALSAGVVCYIRKPVDQELLLRCVRAALEIGSRPEENS